LEVAGAKHFGCGVRQVNRAIGANAVRGGNEEIDQSLVVRHVGQSSAAA
jgi:hypothetical protein